MTNTAAGIVNAALQFTAAQAPPVTGVAPTFDSSVAGQAAQVIYEPTLQMLLRAMDPDFARFPFALLLQGGGTLTTVTPWTFEYIYPTDCLRLRQIAPPQTGAGSLTDINDPGPIRGNVAFDNGTRTKVILTSQQNAIAVYTSSLITEAIYDPAFVEALIRHLANPLGMAVAGRPDFAKELLEQAERYASMAELTEEMQ